MIGSNQNIILGKSLTNMMDNPEVKDKCEEMIEAVDKLFIKAKGISEVLEIYRTKTPSEWDRAFGDHHISVLKGVLEKASKAKPMILSIKDEIEVVESFNYPIAIEYKHNLEAIKAIFQNELDLIGGKVESLQKSKKENTGFFNWLRYFLGKSK